MNAAPGARAAVSMPVLRCLVVDDHPMMREAMSGLLREVEPGVDLTTAGSLAEARAALAAVPFDALVVDLQLPDGDGATLVAEFRQRWSGSPILVLTASEDHAEVRRLMAAGATGFAPKSSGYATLSAALRLVLAGQTYLPPLLLDALPPIRAADVLHAGAASRASSTPTSPDPSRPVSVPEGGPTSPRASLTPRQTEVLRLLCEGLPNKTISRDLGLAERTTKVHVGAIFRALGVTNRTQAVIAARAAGLLD